MRQKLALLLALVTLIGGMGWWFRALSMLTGYLQEAESAFMIRRVRMLRRLNR